MIEKRYEGFLRTPVLWSGNSVLGIHQFEIETVNSGIELKINNKIRLGKYVEQLVFFELSQHSNISILVENIQIQENKITVGELDCLLLKDKNLVHLEIIYKFYLYDESVGNNELEHFIGPNKKDSLIEKLNKLCTSQLPLIYSDACKPYLDNLNIGNKKISQFVYFKAQLFIPFKQKIELTKLNEDCISGFYLRLCDLGEFQNCKFYIPKKLDWLVIPHSNVDWINFEDFNGLAKNYCDEHYAPLCWIKHRKGQLDKAFLVWW